MQADPQRLNELIDYLAQTAQRAEGFVLDQAPLLAQEIVTWHIWVNAAWASFFWILFVLSTAVPMILITWKRTRKHYYYDWHHEACVIFSVASFFLLMLATALTANAAKGMFAPRVVILEKLTAK